MSSSARTVTKAETRVNSQVFTLKVRKYNWLRENRKILLLHP